MDQGNFMEIRSAIWRHTGIRLGGGADWELFLKFHLIIAFSEPDLLPLSSSEDEENQPVTDNNANTNEGELRL